VSSCLVLFFNCGFYYLDDSYNHENTHSCHNRHLCCHRLGPMDIAPRVRQAHAPRPKRVRPTETTRAEEVHFLFIDLMAKFLDRSKARIQITCPSQVVFLDILISGLLSALWPHFL